MAQMDALALEAAEEVFGHGVVIGIALAGHALPDAETGETLTVSVGGVLDAAVGVEDEAGQRLAAPDGHAEGGESEICVDAVGEGVADDLLCAKVFHNSAVEPALAGGDIGNIADPCGVPFPVSWTVKMKKKQKETQDILSYHTQAAGCSDKARAKASGGRQPIEECGRTGL